MLNTQIRNSSHNGIAQTISHEYFEDVESTDSGMANKSKKLISTSKMPSNFELDAFSRDLS
jgi:hypothetical protein